MASPTKDKEKTRLVIHHLSDIHYGLDQRVGGQAALDLYMQPLLADPTRLPDLLVITGDLTISGSAQELTAVANALKPLATAMSFAPRRGIFVVPGPHDLFWLDPGFWNRRNQRKDLVKYSDAITKSYAAFDEAFAGPLFTVPRRAPESRGGKYQIYLLDTCYRPLPNPPEKPEKDIPEPEKLFSDYVDYHDKPGQNGEKLLERMVAANPRDRGQFDMGALSSFAQGIAGVDANDDALRILVTHHPIFACSSEQQAFQVPTLVGEALKTAQARDFQLLLHGHVHAASVVATSYALLPGSTASAIVQIGGGTFAQVGGSTPTYNQIVAERDVLRTKNTEGDDEIKTPYWSVRLETVTVPPSTPARFSPPFLLGRASDLFLTKVQATQENDEELAKRQTLTEKADRVLRMLAKVLQQRPFLSTQPFTEERVEELNAAMNSTLISTLGIVREMVQDTIFAGTPVSFGLLVKPRTPLRLAPQTIDDPTAMLVNGVPLTMASAANGSGSGIFTAPVVDPSPTPSKVLTYRYLLPRTEAGVEFHDTLPYISTMAGWSLILGETLIHVMKQEELPSDGSVAPNATRKLVDSVRGMVRTTIDMEWLTGEKRREVLSKLRDYENELIDRGAKSANHSDKPELDRVTNLANAIERGDPATSLDLLFLPKTRSRNGDFNPFVSVPVPQRLNGFEADLTELAVLQIDMKMLPPNGLTKPQGEMLSDVAHLVWVILATAYAIEDYQNVIRGHQQYAHDLDEVKQKIEVRVVELLQKMDEEKNRNNPYR